MTVEIDKDHRPATVADGEAVEFLAQRVEGRLSVAGAVEEEAFGVVDESLALVAKDRIERNEIGVNIAEEGFLEGGCEEERAGSHEGLNEASSALEVRGDEGGEAVLAAGPL
jgi:hypothetical protein